MKSIGKILGIVTAATLLSSLPVYASDSSQRVATLLAEEANADVVDTTGGLEFIEEFYIPL